MKQLMTFWSILKKIIVCGSALAVGLHWVFALPNSLQPLLGRP
jgi:hypothetical protein